MDEFWQKLEYLGGLIVWPFRTAMEAVGLHPIDIQVWSLMVALFMVAWYAPTSYGDWILSRRSRRTMGEVVEIEASSDSRDTLRISFRDHAGEWHDFSSSLPVNGPTSVVGNPVEVIYDPMRPQRAREAGRWVMKSTQALLWYAMAVSLLYYAVATDGLSMG